MKGLLNRFSLGLSTVKADIVGSCRPFAIIPSNKAYIHSPLEKSNVYKMQVGKAGFFILFSDIQEKGLMFSVTYVSCDHVLFRVFFYVKTLSSSFSFVEGISVF